MVGDLRSQILVLEIKVSELQEAKYKEESKRRDNEDKYSQRVERLYAELEWNSYDRRTLSDKILRLESELVKQKDDVDRIRDLRDEWREKARKNIEDRKGNE